MGRNLLPRLCVIAALAAAGGVGAWVGCARWLPLEVSRDPGRALPGLRIDGETVTGDVRTFVEGRAQGLAARRVRLVVREGDTVRPVT